MVMQDLHLLTFSSLFICTIHNYICLSVLHVLTFTISVIIPLHLHQQYMAFYGETNELFLKLKRKVWGFWFLYKLKSNPTYTASLVTLDEEETIKIKWLPGQLILT